MEYTTLIGCTCVITTMPFGSVWSHLVAGIHLPQSGTSARGRDDARVRQLQLGVLDHPAIGLHGALELPHERSLRVDLLRRDRVLLEQRLIAREVHARVRELGLIARELSVRLKEHHFEGLRIDLGEQLAGLHELALAKEHARELAVDARMNGHGTARGHVAERIQVHREVARACGRDGDRQHRARIGARPVLAESAPFGPSVALRTDRRPSRHIGRARVPVPTHGNGDEERERHADEPAAAARRPRRKIVGIGNDGSCRFGGHGCWFMAGTVTEAAPGPNVRVVPAPVCSGQRPRDRLPTAEIESKHFACDGRQTACNRLASDARPGAIVHNRSGRCSYRL
jgi:hypothetical protein